MMNQKDTRNVSRKRKEVRQAKRDKAEQKIEKIREALLKTRQLEGDFKGPSIIGWTLDENDNPIRV